MIGPEQATGDVRNGILRTAAEYRNAQVLRRANRGTGVGDVADGFGWQRQVDRASRGGERDLQCAGAHDIELLVDPRTVVPLHVLSDDLCLVTPLLLPEHRRGARRGVRGGIAGDDQQRVTAKRGVVDGSAEVEQAEVGVRGYT